MQKKTDCLGKKYVPKAQTFVVLQLLHKHQLAVRM